MTCFRMLSLPLLLLTTASLGVPAQAAAQAIDPQAHIMRLNANGSYDTSFGTNGHFSEPGPVGEGVRIHDVTVTSNGKYLFAAAVRDGDDYRFAVGRANANGTLDTTYSGNGDGFAMVSFGGASNITPSALISMSGKAVAVGGGNGAFAVARLTTGGLFDNTFSSDGRVEISFPGFVDVFATGVAEQSTGKIIVAGWARQLPQFPDGPEPYVFAVARLNSNGTLDSTFDGDGRKVIAFPEGDALAHDVGVVSDPFINDGIAIGGYVDTSNGDRAAVAMLRADGATETAFDGDGRRLVSFPNSTISRCNALRTDGGKVVIGGYADAEVAIARLTAIGSLDSSFSGDGIATLDITECFMEEAYALAIAPDGGVGVAGTCFYLLSNGALESRGAAARVNASGAPLTSFSGDGKIMLNAIGPGNQVWGATFYPNDKFVLGGYRNP